MTLAVSGKDAGATRGGGLSGWLRRTAGSLEEYFCYLLLVVLVVTTSLQVFTRYVLNAPLSWTEELARILLIWITFIGAAVIAKRSGHISIDFVTNLLLSRARRWVLVAAHAASVAILLLLGVKGIALLRITGISASPALEIPWTHVYAAFPVGMFLMAARYAGALVRLLRRPVETEQGTRPAHKVAA